MGSVVQTVAFSSYLRTEKDEVCSEKIRVVEKMVIDSLGTTWLEIKDIMSLPHVERDTYITKFIAMNRIVSVKTKSMKGLHPAVDVAGFVDHIDYMVKLIGIDHVGISADFDGGSGIEGWSDAFETFNVTLELVKRRYTEDEVEKLWGGNLLRVLDQVQSVANEIQHN